MDCYLITTYNRSKTCRELVKSLKGDIYILDDGSDKPYNWIDKENVFYVKQEHKGKERYYETVNSLWKLPIFRYDYYFMIPDDFLPVPGFAEKAKKVWRSIYDVRKICLMTYVSEGRLNKPCWTKFQPIEYDNYRQTQWVDMCFMCQDRFFVAVGEIPQSTLNWEKNPTRSSGVGSLVSSKLHTHRWSIYQTLTSLFIPQNVESQMNSWRDKDDLINKPVLDDNSTDCLSARKGKATKKDNRKS